MNLQKTIQVERSLVAIEARLGPLLDPDYREALARVSSIMAEIRHFAVCWEDASAGAELFAKSKGIKHSEALHELRQVVIDRLIQTIRPD